MPIDFDIEAARKSGATDQQIADYFKEKYSVDFDIAGARKAGANDTQILEYINSKYDPQKKSPDGTGGGKSGTPEPKSNGVNNLPETVRALSPDYGTMRKKTEEQQKVKDEQTLVAQKLVADVWARKPESKKIIESAKANKALTPVPDYATKPNEYSGADAALNVLPSAVKINLLKDKELGQEVMDYLRDNPQEAQKLQFQGTGSVSQEQFTDKNLDTWNNLSSVLMGIGTKYANKA